MIMDHDDGCELRHLFKLNQRNSFCGDLLGFTNAPKRRLTAKETTEQMNLVEGASDELM
jgi:hypothetical protein